MPFRKVLIALDDDPVALNAAEIGVELAGKLGAELGLVSVADRTIADAAAPEMPRDDLLAEARERAAQVMDEWAKRLAPQGAVQTFIAEGHPSDEIVATAQAWGADLVVIGSHGRGGLSHVLLGSVAESVMRHAPCPVLVVRGKA